MGDEIVDGLYSTAKVGLRVEGYRVEGLGFKV